MANHKSALKRARQNDVRRLRNRTHRTRVKHVVKDVRLAVAGQKQPEAAEALKEAISTIDRAAKKKSIHKRTAARKISRLSKLVNKTQTVQ